MKKRNRLKYVALLLTLLFSVNFCAIDIYAAYSDLTEGTYTIKADLSCYVNAMGGIEFGSPLLKSAEVAVDNSGNREMTLHFTKSSVTIYGVTCDTFIDASPTSTESAGMKNGTIGVYGKDGSINTNSVTYTLSSDTAENSAGEQVKYVDSITFPILYESSTYKLTFYINSNVMGVQFCDGASSASAAVLTVDWNSVNGTGQSSTESSTTKASESNAEIMDGLSIYHATEEPNAAENKIVADENIFYSYNPVLVAVFIGLGIAFILMGGMFIIMGNQKKEKVYVIKLDLGDLTALAKLKDKDLEGVIDLDEE